MRYTERPKSVSTVFVPYLYQYPYLYPYLRPNFFYLLDVQSHGDVIFSLFSLYQLYPSQKVDTRDAVQSLSQPLTAGSQSSPLFFLENRVVFASLR